MASSVPTPCAWGLNSISQTNNVRAPGTWGFILRWRCMWHRCSCLCTCTDLINRDSFSHPAKQSTQFHPSSEATITQTNKHTHESFRQQSVEYLDWIMASTAREVCIEEAWHCQHATLTAWSCRPNPRQQAVPTSTQVGGQQRDRLSMWAYVITQQWQFSDSPILVHPKQSHQEQSRHEPEICTFIWAHAHVRSMLIHVCSLCCTHLWKTKHVHLISTVNEGCQEATHDRAADKAQV